MIAMNIIEGRGNRVVSMTAFIHNETWHSPNIGSDE